MSPRILVLLIPSILDDGAVSHYLLDRILECPIYDFPQAEVREAENFTVVYDIGRLRSALTLATRLLSVSAGSIKEGDSLLVIKSIRVGRP